MSGADDTQPSGGELPPMRAIVTPRGRWRHTRASLPIERMLLPRAEGRVRGLVVITAPDGGGKTTALHHLRAVLPSRAEVAFFDTDQFAEAVDAATSGLAILAAVTCDHPHKSTDVIELAVWTLDDCMEYLAACHREQCASVLARLKRDQSLELAGGLPQILSLVMDEMAKDPAMSTSRDVLRQHIGRLIPPGPFRDQLMCDAATCRRLNDEQRRWWRYAGIQEVFTAEWVTDQLCGGNIPDLLDDAPAQIRRVPEIAAAARLRPEAIRSLESLVRHRPRSAAVPMAASILLRINPDWRPETESSFNLSSANLSSARCAGVDLRRAAMSEANFGGADLRGADLSGAGAISANFTGANLRGANLERTFLSQANFWTANLADASLRWAKMDGANLTGTHCQRANFSRVSFLGSNFHEADFTGANFDEALFQDIDFTTALWAGASFVKAHMLKCNLEGLVLPDANFDHADLTGSLMTATRIRGGNFRGATLRQTGLAEIEWPNADLRDADFANASFHLGSSRSGLVGSVIAGEGSRTGFYTDEFQEQNFKAPEEIRKACLCGANLLGAKVEKTDFYLVDLRGAVYSSEQRKHFARTGAILAGPGR